VLKSLTGEATLDFQQSGRCWPEKGKPMKHTPVVVYRNSKNGQITTQQYAVRHPATTERETVYRPSPKKG
jgi:hypothetical protein